jgi:hypothetical protein
VNESKELESERELLEKVLSTYEGLISFKMTEVASILSRLNASVVAIFAGNRAGKTSTVAEHYVQRVLGTHKVPKKNLLAKKVRCMSSSLPESSDVSMQDNAQYIELKKYIPYEQIEKDITARSQNLVVRRPLGLSSPKTVFEFRSSKQELQDLGKINLSSVWHDEETPEDKRTECQMRLIQEGGDELFTLTATNPFSYTYDKVFKRSGYIFRTKTVSEYTGLPQEERHQTGASIASIFMSTWDNPTLPREEIKRMMSEMDPAEIPLRIYGVFTQVTGRVHKTYDPSICFIPFKKHFPDGIPYNWVHSRGIDYHESRIPWSVGWLSASKEDEWFVWKEFHPAIDGPNAYNTYEIAKSIARNSGNYYYTVNLIDPLANKKQANTLFSTTDDLNRYFDQLRREEGLGTPCYWQGWDTKGTGGRDQIATRFKNSVRCGRPFNNTVRDRGQVKRLPTLWICDTAPKFHRSIMDWSYGEYVAASTRAVNDPKPVPTPKNSHDNMVLECLAKDSRLLFAAHVMNNPPQQQRQQQRSVTGR